MGIAPFQTPGWIEAAVSTGRYADASVTTQVAGRELRLPCLRRRLPLGGTVSSMPLGWGFGGLVCASEVTGDDVRAVVDELARQRASDVVLRPGPDQDPAFAESGVAWSEVRENYSFEVDLSPGWPAVSAGFASSVRRAARKAERAGVTVRRRTDPTAVEEFLRLYELSVRRWADGVRLPVWASVARSRLIEPRDKYAAVLRHLGDDCGIWVAEHDGTAVAAIIVLSHQGEYAYWRGAMDADLAGPVRANDLLHVTALEHACAAGERYAMGLTAPDSGLARFKRGFGAQPRVSHEYALCSPWRARQRRAWQLVRSRVSSPPERAARPAGSPRPAPEAR
jgi:hypothetical protein